MLISCIFRRKLFHNSETQNKTYIHIIQPKKKLGHLESHPSFNIFHVCMTSSTYKNFFTPISHIQMKRRINLCMNEVRQEKDLPDNEIVMKINTNIFSYIGTLFVINTHRPFTHEIPTTQYWLLES